MAEDLIIDQALSKKEKYESCLQQIKALIEGEKNTVANLANASAALKEFFGFLWIGFYLVDGDQLVLGPFQGPVACTRINLGKGVCGSAWKDKKTFIVPNVDEFPGHIACSSKSKSEIVVPLVKKGEVWAVLDVDSEQLNHFDETDKHYLEELCNYFA
ncbi:MAG: GAF domain-containing protein [Luteibaculum sp.]